MKRRASLHRGRPLPASALITASPQEDRDRQREAQLNAVFHETPKLEWTLHTGQINDLLYAIEHGTAPLVDGLQGKRSLELITAIYKSAVTRCVVSLPIQRDDPFYRTAGPTPSPPVFMKNPQASPTSAKSVRFPWAKIWMKE
ncbi:glucose--fructose oxidoreductase [Enterobacter cloacae]|uniref:Glucose--fructose oxidoreductase n=1 Tax=Enterobacter cloacae TaxID=550 RepID=A0A377M888_ENTCL|nr:glucose--fructose oxidoreductase [Enterobacter cloacae]